MAKPKGHPGVQNRIIYCRASYLYQAANYLSNCVNRVENAPPSAPSAPSKSSKPELSIQHRERQRALENMSRIIMTDMRAVSLKAQIRQSPALKRTVCKFCDTLLVEGRSCSSTIENLSKGGCKPWADVLVMKCKTCGNVKRFPVDAPRQRRKNLRSAEKSIPESREQDKSNEAKDDT